MSAHTRVQPVALQEAACCSVGQLDIYRHCSVKRSRRRLRQVLPMQVPRVLVVGMVLVAILRSRGAAPGLPFVRAGDLEHGLHQVRRVAKQAVD